MSERMIAGAALLMLGCLGIAAAYSLPENIFLSIYQARDLTRAEGFLRGELTSLGPELNGGGRLPGPFYYLLLAAAMKLGGSWESAIHLLVLLTFLGLAASAFFFLKRGGVFVATYVVAALGLLPLVVLETKKFWNPSFLMPIAVATSLLGFAAIASPGRRLAWFAWGLSCSVGWQIHGTFLGYVIASSAWAFSAIFRDGRAARPGCAAFFLGLAIPLLPALLSSFGEPPEAGHSGTVLDLGSYLRELIQDRPESMADFRPWDAILLCVFLAPLLPGARWTRQHKLALWFTLAQIPCAMVYLTTSYAPRYVVCFLCSVAILSAVRLELWSLRPRALGAYALTFLAAVLWLGQGDPIRRLVWPDKRIVDSHLNLKEVREVVKLVAERTGWTYAEFRRHTLAIALDRQVDFSFAFRDLGPVPGTSSHDGGLVLARNPSGLRDAGRTKHVVQRVLSSVPESSGLKASVDSADADCAARGAVCLIPFRRSGSFPLLAQNLGSSYLDEFFAEFRDLDRMNTPGSVEAGPGKFLFVWNHCGSTSVVCKTGILTEVRRLGDSVEITASVLGRTLSYSAAIISPQWSEAWNSPYVAVECGGQWKKSILASSIGDKEETIFPRLLAPYRRKIGFHCPAGPLRKVAAGFQGYSVTFRRQQAPALTFPGSELQRDWAESSRK